MGKLTDEEQRENIDAFTDKVYEGILETNKTLNLTERQQDEIRMAFDKLKSATKEVVGTIRPGLWAIVCATYGEALLEALHQMNPEVRNNAMGVRTIEEMVNEAIGIKSVKNEEE